MSRPVSRPVRIKAGRDRGLSAEPGQVGCAPGTSNTCRDQVGWGIPERPSCDVMIKFCGAWMLSCDT